MSAKYNVKAGSLRVLGRDKVTMRVVFIKENGVKSAEQPFEVDSTDEAVINEALACAAVSFDSQPDPIPVAADIDLVTGRDVSVESN